MMCPIIVIAAICAIGFAVYGFMILDLRSRLAKIEARGEVKP